MSQFLAGIPHLPEQAGWFSVVLALCFVTAWYANGIRGLFSWQAWTALTLFFLGILASNAWQVIPRPTGELATDPEVQRIWFITATEATHQAKMMVRNLAIGFGLALAFRFPNRAPMLTYLILFVWFGAEVGESLERFVCKRNDPAFGMEHIYRAEGGDKPTCGRAFGDWANLVFPLITVSPLPVVFAVTAWKKRQNKFLGKRSS